MNMVSRIASQEKRESSNASITFKEWNETDESKAPHRILLTVNIVENTNHDMIPPRK